MQITWLSLKLQSEVKHNFLKEDKTLHYCPCSCKIKLCWCLMNVLLIIFQSNEWCIKYCTSFALNREIQLPCSIIPTLLKKLYRQKVIEVISKVNSECVKKVFQINRNNFLEADLSIEKAWKWWFHFTKQICPMWDWFVYLEFLVLSSSSNSLLLLNRRIVLSWKGATRIIESSS